MPASARATLVSTHTDALTRYPYELWHDASSQLWVVFQRRDCAHWICWSLERHVNDRSMASTAQIVAGKLAHVVSGYFHCWKCNSDRWNTWQRKRARFLNETHDAALFELTSEHYL